MIKKFITILLAIIMLITAVGCQQKAPAQGGEGEDLPPNNGGVETFTEPTLTINIYPNFNGCTFEIIEDDPDNVGEIEQIYVNREDESPIFAQTIEQREFVGLLENKTYFLSVIYKYCIDNEEESDTYVEQFNTKLNPLSIPDFIVEVPSDREPVILQLSDTQIIDAAQARPGRTGVNTVYWATDKLEQRLLVYLRETITATNPDLIIITGDLVYGEFDDNGTSLLALINAMESFNIPWAPVFGNHDNESTKGVDWQCDKLEDAKNCLFVQRELTGNGNYTVGISQSGVLSRVFFMMDSNGCSNASTQSLANGHTKTTYGFGDDQIAWFENIGALINETSPQTKISFAFHVQLAKFDQAYAQYGTTLPINIDTHQNQKDGDFGYLGRALKNPWDSSNTVYNKMVNIGCDSIYVGHEHCNSASVVYEGVRFQFGQKISTYDRCNWLMLDGSIVGAYPDPGGKPIMGGTVNVLDKDGSIKDAYIYYYTGNYVPGNRFMTNNDYRDFL